MSTLSQRYAAVDPRWIDAAAAGLIGIDLVLETALERGVSHQPLTAAFGILLASTVAVRRRWPSAAVGACSAVFLVPAPLHGQLLNLDSQAVLFPSLLCAYGAGAWLQWRRGLAAVALAAVLLCGEQLIEIYVTHAGSGVVSSMIFSVVVYLVPWLVGAFIAERRGRAEAFTALAMQTDAERAQREAAAIAQERVEIGRELQDIIAHSVSVMVVQAGGARRTLRADPDRARESILNVEQTGRETLAEMRRLLGLLRKDDDPRALAPQPGLGQLDELASLIRSEGMTCAVTTVGQPVDLTPGIDLVSYRVLEGALHAAAEGGCTDARVGVHYTPGRLELEVMADRPVADVEATLAAMRERVSLYGGRMAVGEHVNFAVRCQLPLEAVGVT